MALSLFLTFAVLEVIFRLLGFIPSFAEPDLDIVWRYAPHAAYRHTGEGFSEGRFNASGLRDQHYSVEKPSDTIRIVLLGDSFLEGMHVSLDSTFAKKTEQVLQGKNVPVEVINFGRSGMGTIEELIVLRRDALKFSPDIVVLFFLPGNDIADALPETALGRMRPFAKLDHQHALTIDYGFRDTKGFLLRETINPLKKRSAFVSYISSRYNALTRGQRLQTLDRDENTLSTVGVASLFTKNPDPAFEKAFNINLIVLEEIYRTCLNHNIRFNLVVLPVYTYEEEAKLAKFGIDPYQVEIRLSGVQNSWCAKNHVPCLGLTKVFRERYLNTQNLLHVRRYGHFNEEGHKLVAKELARFLTTYDKI